MRRKVLVIDDDPVSRKVLSTILDLDHLDVEAVTTRQAAPDRLAAAAADVVVIDLIAGDASGDDVRRRIVTDDRLRSSVVLLLVDDGDPEVDGEADVVVKPYSPLELIARVERLGEPGS